MRRQLQPNQPWPMDMEQFESNRPHKVERISESTIRVVYEGGRSILMLVSRPPVLK